MSRSIYFREFPENTKEHQGRRFKMVPDKECDSDSTFFVYMKGAATEGWTYLGKIQRERGINVTSGYANIRTSWTEPWEYWPVENDSGERMTDFGRQRMGAIYQLISRRTVVDGGEA